MPFQVSLITSRKQLSRIVIALGPDLTSPCATTLTLTANVLSGNPAGHTFLWEQVSGTQVTFTSPVNQLVATCAMTGSTDKTFIFWVDKNTGLERSFPFNYWGTATDNTSLFAANEASLYPSNYLSNGLVICSSINALNPIPVATSSVEINPSNYDLTWSLPSLTGLMSIGVERLTNGIWVEVLSLLPNQTQVYSNVSNFEIYRIRTTYILDNQTYIQRSCNYQINLPAASYNAYANENTNLSSANGLGQLDTVLFTLLSTDSVTNELTNDFGIFGGNGVGQLDTVLFTLLSTDSVTNELTNDFGLNAANGLGGLGVVYLGGTAIGG